MNITSKVKIIAKPDTWYKEGTEVRLAYGKEPYERITFKELYENIEASGIGAVFSGTRIVHFPNETTTGKAVGDEYLDEELCGWEEFTIEFQEYV